MTIRTSAFRKRKKKESMELNDRGLWVLLSHSDGTKDVVESPASIKAVTLVTIDLQTPVKFVKRIGARIGEGLHERGIETVEDLLYHLPFRYEDRLHPKPLSAYQPGEMASVIGEVRGTVLLRTRSGPIFEMTVGVAPIRESQAIVQSGASQSFATSPYVTDKPAGAPPQKSAEGALH